jgi:tetratricopeptide (TPR) repeat protein
VTSWIWTVAVAIIALVAVGAFRSHRELVRWLGRDGTAARRATRALCLIAATFAIAGSLIAASREPPRLSGAGADVVLAIDVSRSMATPDTAPSRIRRALRTAEQVVEAGAGVRLALVLFAGEAYVALPLTQDADASITYLRAIDTEVISRPGTNLARALETSARVFDPDSSRPRQVILLTDGENHGSGLDDALADLRSLGVRVVAVGYGTPEGAYVPGPGNEPLRDARGRAVESRRSDHVLRRVAVTTGGTYHREFEQSPSARLLLPEPQALPVDDTPEAEPVWELWLALAALLLSLELALSAGLRMPRALGRRAAAAAVALGLVAIGPWDRLEEGDAYLDQGQARRALSLYRAYERRSGSTPASRIRIGNAHYRLDEPERAATQYQSVLRDVRPEDRPTRFVASFNLGVAYLSLERFGPARDEFWAALRERPDSLEAKFNYEWARERVPPDPEIAMPPTPQEAEGPKGSDEGARETESELTEHGSEQGAPTLEREEAERWLETLQERPGEPLRREIAGELEREPGPRRGGPTW